MDTEKKESMFFNVELLQNIDSIADEKDIAKEDILHSIEVGIVEANKKKYGDKYNIVAKIDRKDGAIKIFCVKKIVKNVECIFTEINLDDVKKQDKNFKLYDLFYEELPPIDLNRSNAKVVGAIIKDYIQEIEREKEYQNFTNRAGDIFNCVVKRITQRSVIVDLGGRAEGIIVKHHMLPNDNFKINDYIRAYLQKVERKKLGIQLFLSRTDNNMLAQLFAMEVPEISEGIVQIKSVARDPGLRSKIAVFSKDVATDAVKVCIGIRGSRVNAVSKALSGEKIDIINWSDDIIKYMVNALATTEIIEATVNRSQKKIEAIIAKDKIDLAIGKKGQNIKLASHLIDWHISLITDEEKSKQRLEQFNDVVSLFKEYLGLEEILAQVLTSQGFTSLEQIVQAEVTTLSSIEGFNEEIAQKVKTKAQEYLTEINEKHLNHLEELGLEQELLDLYCTYTSFRLSEMVTLAQHGIKNSEDLEEIDFNEIIAILPNTLVTKEEIDNVLSHIKEVN